MFTRVVSLLAALLCACDGGLAPYVDQEDQQWDVAFPDGNTAGYTDCQMLALLDWVNNDGTTAAVMKAAGVHTRAANNLAAHRDGEDGERGTADDRTFATVFEIDAVPYVGPAAMSQLADHAGVLCVGAPDETLVGQACAEDSLLSWLNGADLTEEALKAEGVHTQAARNIVAFRAGEDGTIGTADDGVIADMQALDAIPYVGPAALEQLVAIGKTLCSPIDVVMSPQPYDDSHLARVVDLLDGAEKTLDVAMYSFRDSQVKKALIAAADRGLSIRVLLQGANDDRKDPEGTLSATLEDAGMEVRWVNKIMHHKFAIVDGPRTSLDAAATGILTTGSGNWSYSAGTRYDENTVFVQGDEKLLLAFQQEFNLLWDNSRPVVWNESIPPVDARTITDEEVDAAAGSTALFTSANFRTYVSSTYGPTFGRDGDRSVVVDALVDLIDGAQTSVAIASGHMRFRPLHEALLRAHERGVDVLVYLDGQEYTSRWYAGEQEDGYEDCLADAVDADDLADCDAKGQHFGYWLGEAGIDVRYKYYAYRWDYTYAEQMHHKYVIIDGHTVATGSYNFSPNAEWDTLENVIVFEAARYPSLVEAFVANLQAIAVTGQAEARYDALLTEITSGEDSSFPIVFAPMSLDHDAITHLKDIIRDHCPAINSEPFRTEPGDHQWCDRE